MAEQKLLDEIFEANMDDNEKELAWLRKKLKLLVKSGEEKGYTPAYENFFSDDD